MKEKRRGRKKKDLVISKLMPLNRTLKRFPNLGDRLSIGFLPAPGTTCMFEHVRVLLFINLSGSVRRVPRQRFPKIPCFYYINTWFYPYAISLFKSIIILP